MPAFDSAILPEKKGKLAVIFKWLTENGMTEEQAKATLRKVKNSIFEALKHQHIEDTYDDLFKGLAKLVS